MAKTLVDFRAEQGLYLKDLAAILEISEEELRAVEESGTVPAEIGQRLILHYALPEDYFSLPDYNHRKVNSIKKTPEKPMRYFEIVSFASGDSGEKLTSKMAPDLTAFSPEELTILDEIIYKFGNITANQLSELSHKEDAWIKFKDTSRYINYTEAFTLRAL